MFDLKMQLCSIEISIYTGRDSPVTNEIASPLLNIDDTQWEQMEYDWTKHRGR